MKGTSFEALTIDTLPTRLADNQAMQSRVGSDAGGWKVQEVGDGNLNLVFLVEGPDGSVVVKQALPYVRLVGESWPLTLKRSYFEYNALVREAARDPGMVPETYSFDEAQAIIVMQYLSPHVILRRALIQGRQLPKLSQDLGQFLARTLFRGSDLHMKPSDRKDDLALFAGNVELCAITEDLVFSDPYFEAKLNRHTTPQLDGLVFELRADRDLKVEVQYLKHLFATCAETLLHGDLHTGSVMVTEDDTKVIDPEFAFYGPMAFDVGMLLSNFWMSYFSQRGQETTDNRDSMRRYLLTVVDDTWTFFRNEFSHLWRTERDGMLYDRNLFENRDDLSGAEQALTKFLQRVWRDMLGFAGVEIHRRILGLAHNADFETIADPNRRAKCETAALKFGRHLILNRSNLVTFDELNDLAAELDSGSAS